MKLALVIDGYPHEQCMAHRLDPFIAQARSGILVGGLQLHFWFNF